MVDILVIIVGRHGEQQSLNGHTTVVAKSYSNRKKLKKMPRVKVRVRVRLGLGLKLFESITFEMFCQLSYASLHLRLHRTN